MFRRREIYDLLEAEEGVIRPANFSPECPGTGVFRLDLLRCSIAVVNLMGTAGMEPLANPFDTADRILKTLDTPFVVLDFHAETTSEKRAMGFYLDGRVSVVAGTHTHVQTADEQILPGGTAYLTDLGMCGPVHSVLGVKPEQVIARFRNAMPTRFENPAGGPQYVCGLAVTLDERTGAQPPSSGFPALSNRDETRGNPLRFVKELFRFSGDYENIASFYCNGRDFSL